jgi:WD40 repeat protein
MFRFLLFVICVCGVTVGVLWATGNLPGAASRQDNPQRQQDAVGNPIKVGSAIEFQSRPPTLGRPGPPQRIYVDSIFIPDVTPSPVEEIDVSSRINGKLEEVYVDVGHVVRRNQMLGKLDDSLAQFAVENFKIKANSSQSIRVAELRHEVFQKQVERDEQVGAAVPQSEKDMHRAQRDGAFHEIQKAKEEKQMAGVEFKQKERELELHRIKTDVSGEVTRVYKKRGEMVREGEPIFRIVNYQRLWLEGAFEFQQAHQVREGTRVTVEPEQPRGWMKELRGHTATVTGLAVSSDSRLLASSGEDGRVILWDWRQANRPVVLRDEKYDREFHAIACALVNVDGKGQRTYVVLAGGADGGSRLWTIAAEATGRGGEERVLRVLQDAASGHRGAIRAVALSPDAAWCATGGDDGNVIVWRTADAALLYRVRSHDGVKSTAHRSTVTSVSFTPDGHLVTASADKTLARWKLGEAGAELVRRYDGRSGDVTQLGVAADGRRALFDMDDDLRIIDLESGETLATISSRRQGHFKALGLFSPSATTVLSLTANGRLTHWSMPAAAREASFFRQAYQDGFRKNSLFVLGVLSSAESYAAPLLAPAWAALASEQPNQAATHEGAGPMEGLSVVPQLWPVNAREIQLLATPDAAAITCGAFAPDESALFTAGSDKIIRVWAMPGDIERKHPLEAVVTYVGKQIEAGTGLVRIRAQVDNPTDPLYRLPPGVRVNLTVYPETAPRR